MHALLLVASFMLFVSFTSFVRSTSVSSVSLTFSTGCASSTGGHVKCWGSTYRIGIEHGGFFNDYIGNEPDEMGTFLPAVNVGTNRTVKALAYGLAGGHTCAILENNDLKCWGLELSGALGGVTGAVGADPGEMGDNLDNVNLGTGRFAAQAAIGSIHTCAVLDNADLKCWGNAAAGKLGVGFKPDLNRLGDVPEEMGDALLPVNLGAGRTALQVSCGHRHTCAVLDNNQLKCWGEGLHGQLGNGLNVTLGENASHLGDNLLPIDLGDHRSAVEVGCGYQHTCALLDNQQIKCWGNGDRGQLGNGRPDKVGNSSDQMGDNLAFVDLGTNLSVAQLSVGAFHTCVLFTNQKIKCFGSGGTGELGLEHPDDVGAAANEMGDVLPFIDIGSNRSVVRVEAGFSRTCAILDDGSLKCWGFNFDGQLGSEDEVIRGRTSGSMGDALPVVDLAFGQPLPTPGPTASPTLSPSGSPSVSPTHAPTTYPTAFPTTSSPTAPPVDPLLSVVASPEFIIGMSLGGSCFIVMVTFLIRKRNESRAASVINNRNSLQQNNVRYQGGGSGSGSGSGSGTRSSPLAIAVAKREKEEIPVAKVISP